MQRYNFRNKITQKSMLYIRPACIDPEKAFDKLHPPDLIFVLYKKVIPVDIIEIWESRYSNNKKQITKAKKITEYLNSITREINTINKIQNLQTHRRSSTNKKTNIRDENFGKITGKYHRDQVKTSGEYLQ